MKRHVFLHLMVIVSLFSLILHCQKDAVKPPSDESPPVVKSVYPPDKSSGVSAQCTLKVTFNEAVQMNSVQIALESNNTTVAGQLSGEGQTVQFIPQARLQYATTYQAIVKAGVKDKAGNAMKQDYAWTFTTEDAPAVPDTIPPQVVSTIPADGDSGVAPSVIIKVVFSEKVNLPQEGFSLRDENGAYLSGARATVDSIFTFTPQSSLVFNTAYTATVKAFVTDKAGNHLPQDYVFSFTVKPDDVPPDVLETFPADGDTGIAKDSDVWVKFSEEIDQATVNATTFSITGPSSNVSGSYAVNNDTARFSPDSLGWQTTYTVTLSGITDLAGNPMASTYSFSFTTQADTTPRWVVNDFWVSRLAIDDNGYIYAVGYPYWIVKFDPQGRLVWQRIIPGINDTRDVAVFDNNIYVLGVNAGNMGGPGRVVKLDGSGNIIWTSQDFSFMPISVETGNDGRVFAIGSGASYEFDSGTGNIIHVLNIGTNNTGIYDIVAFSDYIYVSGETYEDLFTPKVNGDWFVAKYDANYNLIWGIQFNGPDSVAEYKGKLAVDRSSNLFYIGGGYGIETYWVNDGIAAFHDDGDSASFVWFKRVTDFTSPLLADLYAKIKTYNGSVYYGNFSPNTPVKVLADGTIAWNITSDGVEDFVFYNGKMYALFHQNYSTNPPIMANKIYIFDAETGAPLN